MKVVVTGVAGFIGSSLAHRLLTDSDVEVVGIDSLTDYYDAELKRANLARLTSDRFHFIEDDLATMNLEAALRDAVAIFHQAGQPGVRKSWGAEFSEYTTQNVLATQRLLEHARSVKSLDAFVYASSSSVYGDAESYPTSETDRPMPVSPYGVTKLAAEHLTTLYGTNFGVPTISLRYFTVYGPAQRPDMAFNKFFRAALQDQEIPVYGDGEQIREFTHVSDIVEANLLAWKKRTPPGSVVNLSGGSSVSVNEILSIIGRLTGKALRITNLDKVPGDVLRTGGSTQRAAELLGWKPLVSIEDGLQSEYEWLVDQLAMESQGIDV